jgi:hypothetical protein
VAEFDWRRNRGRFSRTAFNGRILNSAEPNTPYSPRTLCCCKTIPDFVGLSHQTGIDCRSRRNAVVRVAAAPGGYVARSRAFGFCQKNAPLVSRPIWAKLTFVVALETNLKPCPVLFLVVAVTAIVADVSKKSPEN